MPYSFTQIEKEKTTRIFSVFCFLIFFYFFSTWVIVFLTQNAGRFWYLFKFESGQEFHLKALSLKETGIIFLVAGLLGAGHWIYTINTLLRNVLHILKAEDLGSNDRYHQIFKNIVEEVSVATGGTAIIPVVLPTMAINAFCISDLAGNHVIGVTEGMLARLSRAQIEAVVGHEAAHIVSGDSLSATITSSLFELYSGMLKGIEKILSHADTVRDVRASGGPVIVLALVYSLLFITRGMSGLMSMFISREREYRADAVAVRLTRDPLSLAEALASIRYYWHGSGIPAEELATIFIVNPTYCSLDEDEGLWADLFSTHPPMERRLKILLDMAHSDIKNVVEEIKRKAHVPRISPPNLTQPQGQWMILEEGKWMGPFDAHAMSGLKWIRPETWIEKVGTDRVIRAVEDGELKEVVVGKQEAAIKDCCPRCQVNLREIFYEGTPVKQCSFCAGVLARDKDIQKIILRHEVGFDNRIRHIAQKIREEDKLWKLAKIDRNPGKLYACPVCDKPNQKMHRMFYTASYMVEVDHCLYCNYYWFDKDELEVLQCLIEMAIIKDPVEK